MAPQAARRDEEESCRTTAEDGRGYTKENGGGKEASSNLLVQRFHHLKLESRNLMTVRV